MALVVVLVAAVVVVVLVVRAAGAPGSRSQSGAPRPPGPRRPGPSRGAVGPDDDPEFLRELQRRARRDDSPA